MERGSFNLKTLLTTGSKRECTQSYIYEINCNLYENIGQQIMIINDLLQPQRSQGNIIDALLLFRLANMSCINNFHLAKNCN